MGRAAESPRTDASLRAQKLLENFCLIPQFDVAFKSVVGGLNRFGGAGSQRPVWRHRSKSSSVFGSPMWGQPQRQLTQQDVAEITRQLVAVIPQVIGNLQAFSQQR
jgi:hypothetical protein